MKFIMFVIDDRSRSGNAQEMAAIDEFNDFLQANQHWVMAAGLGSPESAHVFDNRDSAGLVSEGSFFDSPDFYSGFWIVEAENLDAAKQLAAQGSMACNRKVELRPFL
jgi:hypothetical protein